VSRPAHTLAELCAWEAVTSLGESATETSLLWEAGITNVAPSRFVLDDGERVAMCCSPALTPELLGVQRMLALLEHVLDRMKTRNGGAQRLQGITTLLLCLPERLAHEGGGYALNPQGQSLVDALRRSAVLAPWAWQIECFPFGRAAGAVALHRAGELIAAGQRVLWAGVDSQHDWEVLTRLAADDRLLHADNVDGVLPGEAAAVAVLQRAENAARPVVLGLGLGRQTAEPDAIPARRADGFARAINGATGLLRERRERCGYWLVDSTHEVAATQRLQHVLAVCGDIVGTQTALHAPLKTLGDAGAASLPLFAALASEAWRHGSADDETALLAACSENGASGAVLLGASTGRLST
jgi:hypothetical protein